MISSTSLPIFPACPTYGFTSRPEYLVKIISREGGIERRDRKWAEPLHYYDGAPMGPRPQADIEAIANFWHALGGTHQRFLFKDWADYKSCALDDDVSALDQVFEVLGGGSYQMVKTYTVQAGSSPGGLETVRTIRHPKGNTVRVANELGVEQSSSNWTIDEDTGILTTTGGFSGTPSSWGGEFYVPCRFDGELRIELVNFKIQSLAVSIKELRPEE